MAYPDPLLNGLFNRVYNSPEGDTVKKSGMIGIAALLGGISNPWGAVAGGFIVGVLENLAGAYLPSGTQLKLTIALIVIVTVLLVRPSGLFGRTLETRV